MKITLLQKETTLPRYCPYCGNMQKTRIEERKTKQGTMETWTCQNGHRRIFMTS